jgi:hypothetical protein
MTPTQFHDLLDDATRTAPLPAHDPGGVLEAGRTALRRRRGLKSGVGIAAATAIVIGATALSGAPPAADGPTRFANDASSLDTSGTSGTTGDAILSDVVDAAFPTPGDPQLRNIRVQTFLHGWGLERCGGRAAPLDSTADRFEQDVLPNLELIRVRGFTEPSQESFRGVDDDCQIGDELQAAAPAWAEWRELTGPWLAVVDEALGDERLVALKAPMADCLRAATGLEIDDRDPVDSLLGAVDHAGARGAKDQEQQQRAVAFADCGETYFGTLESLLLAQRPTLVAQHRQLLEDFAHQLADLGYTP